MSMMRAELPVTFRADHVGSFVRPGTLLDARHHFYELRDSNAEQLRAAEDAAVRAVVKFQEQLGFKVITDGEFRRASWHADFLTRLGGVVERGAPPALQIQSPIRHLRAIQAEDYRFVKAATPYLVKVTLPAPTMLPLRAGGGLRRVYPDIEDLFADVAAAYRAEIAALAAAGCTYVQLDDTRMAALCGGGQREAARAGGDDPQRLIHQYAQLLNDSLRDRPDTMTVGLHLCRGNLRSQWAAQGGYEPLAEVLFNQIEADTYLLDYQDARGGDFAPLRHVPQGKLVVMGLVSTAPGELQSKDDLKRRLHEAARHLPLAQMCLSPQCGFSSSVHGHEVAVEQQAAKCRLVIETAQEVWGSV
jgi:5-methyltetrahydropteroyltriglutamate--homocysteine methyltransferase